MEQNEIEQLKTSELERHIRALQTIQKRNSPKTAKWQKASEFLAPMFAEMAKRQKAGTL
jgi:alkyl hydroperoxide reductase subunit AhpC